MAKIIFITFYDQNSPGLRIMSQCLQDSGHNASIIYFKKAYSQIINDPHPNPVSGEVFRDFQLKEYARSDEPWTENEVTLLLSKLKEGDPDIIGISNRSPLDKHCLPVLAKIKNTFQGSLLVAGGWGPLLAPDLYLQYVDYVVFGEGEQPIVDISNAIDNNLPVTDVDNLIYMKNGLLHRNSVLKPVNNLDLFPLPDFDNPDNCLIDDNRIYNTDPANSFDPSTDTYSLLIGRGCIRSCSYCSQGQWKNLYLEHGGHHIKPHRIRSTEHILKECRRAKERGYKYISILESHLTGSKRFLLDFFNQYEKEIGLKFTAYLHPQQIVENPEIIEAACRAGFSKGPIGVQHGSESFCREYFHRKIPNHVINEISNMYRDCGVQIEYQFIAGIPFETEQTLIQSLNFVKQLEIRSNELMVSRLKVFPRSPLEALIQKRQLPSYCHPNTWYFTALLYTLRTMFDEHIFTDIFKMTIEYRAERQKTVTEMLPTYYNQLQNTLKQYETGTYSELLEPQFNRYL